MCFTCIHPCDVFFLNFNPAFMSTLLSSVISISVSFHAIERIVNKEKILPAFKEKQSIFLTIKLVHRS